MIPEENRAAIERAQERARRIEAMTPEERERHFVEWLVRNFPAVAIEELILYRADAAAGSKERITDSKDLLGSGGTSPFEALRECLRKNDKLEHQIAKAESELKTAALVVEEARRNEARAEADATRLRETLEEMTQELRETKSLRHWQDAERYRWLREGDYSLAIEASLMDELGLLMGDALDAAIDAARAKGRT